MPTIITTLTTPKQDNNNTKEDNPVHKLDPEKLETKLTNAYNEPQWSKMCYHEIYQVQ
jgi:hypothetical protein